MQKNVFHSVYFMRNNVMEKMQFQSPMSHLAHNSAHSALFRKRKKAGYTATPVACGWAGAVLEEVTRAFGQKQFVRKLKDAEKVKTRHRPFGAAAPKRANSERFRDRAEQKRNKGEQSALLSEQTNCLSAMESKQSRRIVVEKNKRK